jgi:hypothetical protein
LNFDQLHELFTPDLDPAARINDDEDIIMADPLAADERPKLRYYIYPQALLKTHGHIQANRLVSSFDSVLTDVNRSIVIRNDHLRQDHLQYRDAPDPLTGVSFQAYNEAMHRIRPLAKYHDVQLGLITSNLVGTYSRSEKSKSTAEQLFKRVKTKLPHDKFSDKINTDGLSRNLRLENVYTLDLFAMNPPMRTGWHVYQSVIVPLTHGWSNPRVVGALKPHLTIFKPHVSAKLMFDPY